jgi:Glyoxalase-like domain
MRAVFRWSAVTIDCTDPVALAQFWGAILNRTMSVPLPGWCRLDSHDDSQPEITFQPVPEPKQGKARLHLDVAVDDIDTAVDLSTNVTTTTRASWS